MKKTAYIFLVCLLLLVSGYFLSRFLSRNQLLSAKQKTQSDSGIKNTQPEKLSQQNAAMPDISQSVESENTSSDSGNNSSVELQVPFSVQAPFGNWKDPVFQNACEESSIVMAMGWINGKREIAPQEAQNSIKKIVEFENKNFGYDADTDVFEVQKIFQQYFKQQNVSVQEKISVEDIRAELRKGNLVLVPAFGQALHNPNYTSPGPIPHMLVVIGYDPLKKEFITNDTGTKHGKGYRYSEDVLFGAIWEYPSGKGPLEKPTLSWMKKAMVIVSKN